MTELIHAVCYCSQQVLWKGRRAMISRKPGLHRTDLALGHGGKGAGASGQTAPEASEVVQSASELRIPHVQDLSAKQQIQSIVFLPSTCPIEAVLIENQNTRNPNTRCVSSTQVASPRHPKSALGTEWGTSQNKVCWTSCG